MPNLEALIISGADRIAALLERDETIIKPAYACRHLDGFVNDTFTEYANASIYRPASVCRAHLVSTLRDSVAVAGRYYFGFTMYTAAGHDEAVDMWIGHRRVATAHLLEADNRVHLFVAPAKFFFKGGELIRLETAPTQGPCRIEDIVLLQRKPRPSRQHLEIVAPRVDMHSKDDGTDAIITWTTNRPAVGHLEWRADKGPCHRLPLDRELVNFEIILPALKHGESYSYEIYLKDRSGSLSAQYRNSFKTDRARAQSRVAKKSLPLLSRRSAPAPWPVSVGVPFPTGELGQAQNLRLLDARKREIPLQVTALTHWPDGTIRWALLDFHSGETENLKVEYGDAVLRNPVSEPLEIEQKRTGITVTTGPLKVEFDPKTTLLPGRVSIRGEDGRFISLTPNQPPPAATLTDHRGRRYTSTAPESLTVEEAGPLRACIRIDLSHEDRTGAHLFRSTFRIHLFRGSSLIKVCHTFFNDRTAEDFTYIRALRLDASFDLGAPMQGTLDGCDLGTLSTTSIDLRQRLDNRYALTRGSELLRQGRRASGDVLLEGPRANIGLSMRDFWQNYPKGLEVNRRGLSLHLCPALQEDDYPRGGEREDRLFYYLLDGRYKFKSGVSRTSEFWFHFSPSTPLPHLQACVQDPPIWSISRETYNRAATPLPGKDPSPYPAYESWVEAARRAYVADRQESRAYGMLNFGDWFGERTYNWGNLEYDATWSFLQEFLRGGHADFYTLAAEAAHHLVDVDTCHHSSSPADIGRQYTHCVGHVGDYYPTGYRERAQFTGHSSVSHTWVEGLFLHYLLSGDLRLRQSAEKTCRLLVGDVLNHYDFTNCRNSGWHLIHLMAAYRTTGHRIYLNAARLIVDRVLERQRPSGGWDRLMVPGHCLCIPPRHMGNAGFMIGILTTGLKHFWEETGDQRVASCLVRAADYLIDAMWESQRAAFRYTTCPTSSVIGSTDLRILKAIATAYRLTGRKRFKQVLAAGLEAALAGSNPRPGRGVGKSVCARMREAPQVLAALPGKKK